MITIDDNTNMQNEHHTHKLERQPVVGPTMWGPSIKNDLQGKVETNSQTKKKMLGSKIEAYANKNTKACQLELESRIFESLFQGKAP